MRPWLLIALALSGCGSSVNRLARVELQSTNVGKEMAYEVWAPLDHRDDERLPLLVFLHGGGDNENSFDDKRVGQHLDAELAAGNIPRAVIVVPRGELGFWENWYDGSKSYRDWVVKEVMPAVRAAYHTLPCPEGCHVAGVSMGGHGTMRFAFFHPDLFSTASSLSGPILDSEGVMDFANRKILLVFPLKLFIPVEDIWGPLDDMDRIHSEDLFRQWTTQADLKGLRLMVAVAERDRSEIIETNRKFHLHLVQHEIVHQYFEFPGEHKWVSWTPVIDRVLRFAVWGHPEAKSAQREQPPDASEQASRASPGAHS